VWGGGVPLPSGGGFWGGGCAPPQKFFLIFHLKIVSFSAFWGVFYHSSATLFTAKISVFLAYRTFFNILHYKMACFGRLWCATCTVDRCCQTGNVHVKCEMSMCRSSGVCVGEYPPPQPTRGLGDRRELTQRGPGQSPGRKRICSIF